MKKLCMCLLLAMALSINALALEVPTNTEVRNLNGSQQLIKTYVLPPDADPQELVEEPFEQEGYLYTFADIIKEENQMLDSSYHRETVTLETETDDLAAILERLKPSIEYDDGLYTGTLALDHTSIHTEAAGYETRSSNVTATKTIGPVDRNDMSYVPATTVKNGITLKLSGVAWQVMGTDLVGDALIPSSYQAVATYSGKSYYKAATGYVTTVDYVGEISRDDVESITYQVKYLGTEGTLKTGNSLLDRAGDVVFSILPYALSGLGLLAAAIMAVMLLHSRRQLEQLQTEQEQSAGHYDEEEEQE